jgi:hypothetical protein
MNGFDLALAALLLTAPPGTLNLDNPTGLHTVAAPTLTALALQWELLDAREGDYLKNAQEFVSDLKVLQGRYAELRNAPPVNEIERFPSRDLVNDMLAFNRTYHDSVHSRQSVDMLHSEELQVILAETDQLHRVYEAVRDARCDYYYVTYRRQALNQLRDLIGLEAYYTGQLPPHVPLWRIPEGQ